MKNYVQPGHTINIVVPAGGVTAGVPILVGSLFGVAAVDAVEADTAEIQVDGVFELAKAAGTGWTLGQLLYWDDTDKNVQTTSDTGANKLIGVAVRVEASAAVVGWVRLNGTTVS